MTTTKQFLVEAAARNNAEWCAVMNRSHGLTGEFDEAAWSAATRTAPYYPDAVTLARGVDAVGLLSRIDTTQPGASVKDSFADLDLTPAGFEVLFDAHWIHRPAGTPTALSDLAWHVADTPASLRAWAFAWDDEGGDADLFRPELLEDPSTFVLAGHRGDGPVVAGAIAVRSDNVVGISNTFTTDDGPATAWPLVLTAAHHLFPALPLVGYEHGDDVDDAACHGFEVIGPLRVWLQA